MKRFLLIFLLLFIVPLVHAAKPDSYIYEYADIEQVVNCGAFSVMDDFVEVGKVQEFLDKEGNLVRQQVHVTVYDDMYRDDDFEGPHLYGTGHVNGRLYFDKDDGLHWSESGLGVSIIVPGEGPLFLDVGRLVYSESSGWNVTFIAGNRHNWEFEDFDALCEYFE